MIHKKEQEKSSEKELSETDETLKKEIEYIRRPNQNWRIQ